MTLFFLSCIWYKIAPNAFVEASVCNSNGRLKSGNASIGGDASVSLSWLNMRSSFSVHCQSLNTFLEVFEDVGGNNSVRSLVIFEKSLINLL